MKTVADIKSGHKKAAHCELRKLEPEFKHEYKCAECKKEILFGEKYFKIGARATTVHERFYGSQGCIGAKYCEECACVDLNPFR